MDYTYWNAAINNEERPPIHEGDIYLGFWKRTYKNKPSEAVAIWLHEDKPVARINDEMIVNEEKIQDMMTWLVKNPITKESFDTFIETGQWIDEPDTVVASIGHNMPSDPFEALKLQLEEEQESVSSFLKEPIKTQEQADKAASWSKRVAAIAKQANELHKKEKKPHLDAGRAVDEKYRDLKEQPKALSDSLKRHIQPYLIEQDRLRREEEDRKRKEAEEAAKKAQTIENEQARLQAKQEAEKLAKEAAKKPKPNNVGRTGAKVTLREYKIAKITDYDALLIALKDRDEVKELVNSLANRAAKSGVELNGMEIITEKKAA